ncbi:type IV secretory system conjugative DNA transfer family protein, partial [Patescibacteria group bacterium]
MPEFLELFMTSPVAMGGLAGFGVACLIGAGVLLSWYRQKVTVHDLLDTVLLSVEVPKEVSEKDEEAKKQEKELISVGEQLYASMGSLLAQKTPFLSPSIHFTLEVVAMQKQVFFFISTPRKYKEYVRKAINAQYPRAVIEETEDYNIFTPEGVAAAMELKLRSDVMFPVKTYQKMETDPLNMLTNTLSKLDQDEGAAVQVVFRLAPRGWRKRGLKAAKKMMVGREAKGFVGEATSLFEKEFEAATTPENIRERVKMQKDEERQRLTPLEEERVKSIEEKANKTAFETKIRIVTSAPTLTGAKQQLGNIFNSFAQFDIPESNGFTPAKRTPQKRIINNYIFRNFGKPFQMYLNTEELTSVFHLPIRTTETAAIKRLEAKQAPAPPNMSAEGMLIGINVYQGQEQEVRISDKDMMRHLYIIGKTGGGKSVYEANLARYHIEKGRGVCVVDPHGDLVEDLLATMPKERAEDVIIFDPSDIERPMGLNMLDYNPDYPEQKDLVVGNMIRVFEKLFPPEMIGPMFEHNMRNVMLTLLDDPKNPGTLVDIPRMFTDEDFQKQKLRNVKDPLVKDFWEKEMAKTSDFHKSEMLGYLISKVGRFVENTTMRNIIGQPRSAFDFRKVMDEEKILLVNLSKGKVGEINSDLLGMIIVTKIQMGAMSRADVPEEQRKPFYLLLDEFQNFVTESIAVILSEARKYKLSMTMAHQYVAQLAQENEAVRDAVFGNVGSMVVMRVGAPDAEFLESEFVPVFDRNDLMNVEKFSANAKIIVDNKPTKPFNMKLPPMVENANPKQAEIIKQISRLKYGKERSVIEEEIMRRFRSARPERKSDVAMGSFR